MTLLHAFFLMLIVLTYFTIFGILAQVGCSDKYISEDNLYFTPQHCQDIFYDKGVLHGSEAFGERWKRSSIGSIEFIKYIFNQVSNKLI